MLTLLALLLAPAVVVVVAAGYVNRKQMSAETRQRDAGRAYRKLSQARYLIACAERCDALPRCRAAYLAEARAMIAGARTLTAV